MLVSAVAADWLCWSPWDGTHGLSTLLGAAGCVTEMMLAAVQSHPEGQ